MAKKPLKVRRRKNSNFGPGTVTLILYVLGNGLFFGLRGDFGNLISEIYGFFTQGNFGLALLITACLLGTIAFYFVPYVYGTNRMLTAQARRDAAVGLSATNALFLRPFYLDTRISFPNPFEHYAVPGFDEPDTFRQEEFVGRVLEPYIDVVQVGGGGYMPGNGRIQVQGEGWEQTVIRAIEAATVVVIVPVVDRDEETGQMRGQGTIWELKHLVESGHIDRTLALMPKDTGAGWEQARAAVAEFGLKLPAYNEKGCVLTFERVSGAWQTAATFGENDLAAGLVGALGWMAERHGFELLNRY